MMKKFVLLSYSFMSLVNLMIAQAPQKDQNLAAKGPDMSDYTIFRTEDFKSSLLDRGVWDYRKEGLVEQGSIYRKENSRIKNGILYLVTDYSEGQFSGVSVSTEKQPRYNFRYGYFEMRAALPQTKGNVAAFWMQSPSMHTTFPIANPSRHGVEVDMLEYSPSTPDVLYHSLHWNGYDMANGGKQVIQQDAVPGISKGFHRFGFEWTPREYVIYVDGVEKVRTSNTISHVHEFMVLGCGTGGFGGAMNPLGPWPDSFAIDYIKFYKRNPEVTMYGDCDGYGWVSKGLQPGNYSRAALEAKGVLNDATSSMEIPKGWKLIAYADDDFKGEKKVFSSDIPCLQEKVFNDKISSLRIIEDKK